MMPTVSVIIASYNHEKYIRECIQSALDQTYQDFEILITDDGSKDGTVEIIEGFDDPRIRLFMHSRREGASTSFNNCIRHASGKYIAFLGSDDTWYPEKLELQVKHLDEHPYIAAVFSNVDWVDEVGSPIPDEENTYRDLFKVENRSRFQWLRVFFVHGNFLNMPSSLVRRGCLSQIGLLNPLLAGLHDLDLWIRICFRHEIMFLDQKLLRYRWPSDKRNASANTDANNTRNRFEYKQIYDHYLDITEPGELLAIFPDAAKYGEVRPETIPYFLGRIAIEAGMEERRLWGMEKIYALLQDDNAARSVERYCSFTYVDFMAMVSVHDVFNRNLVAGLTAKVAEQGQAIAERDRAIAGKDELLQSTRRQLSDILGSKLWKVATVFRKIRLWLIPANGVRERFARQVWRRLQAPRGGNGR